MGNVCGSADADVIEKNTASMVNRTPLMTATNESDEYRLLVDTTIIKLG